VWERTYRFGSGLLGVHSAGGTRREVEQFIVHPNEIKTLRTGEAIVIVKQPDAKSMRVTVDAPRLALPTPSTVRDQTPPTRQAAAPSAARATRAPTPARGTGRAADRGGAELG
jgi:hypothetical protein